MIALYLIAAHLVGDFVLQTRWQAVGNLHDSRLRARHVSAYALPFIPVCVAVHSGWAHGVYFIACLEVLHFVTDSRRFHSTLGDVIAHLLSREQIHRPPVVALRDLAPNPWPPLPILIDQSLHAVQLAVLGGLFLS